MFSYQHRLTSPTHSSFISHGKARFSLKDERVNIIGSALRDNRSSSAQLKSQVKSTGQNYPWGNGESTLVGKKMVAHLDPKDPLQGQSASVNKDQDDMMHWLKQNNHLNASWAVKGHLLNDNLGGTAMNVNLFPITKAANSVHLNIAENIVKNKLWDEGQPIYYCVEASIGSKGFDHLDFKISDWNMVDGNYSLVREGRIDSDMGNPKDTDMANADDLDNERAEVSAKKASDLGRAYIPHKNVGDLNDSWRELREYSGEIDKLAYNSTIIKASKPK